MGNLCCCVKSQGYEAIDGDADMAPSSVNPTPHKDKAGSSSVADTKEDAFQFAENSPVFQGTVGEKAKHPLLDFETTFLLNAFVSLFYFFHCSRPEILQ